MNIFFLDLDFDKNARCHFDSHIRSGIVESITMMGFAYDNKKFPFWPNVVNNKNNHINHPMSIWVRGTLQNYDFCLQYCDALIKEFNYRFNKPHKCEKILDWLKMNVPLDNLENLHLTIPPRCFGNVKSEIRITDDIVRDYRFYYQSCKSHLLKYTKREKPDWWSNDRINLAQKP